MKSKTNKNISNGKLALIIGAITFILFSTRPYLLDLIAPAKSIGQIIGENAKDLMDSLNGNRNIETKNSGREIWSDTITILAFILFATTIILSMKTIPSK